MTDIEKTATLTTMTGETDAFILSTYLMLAKEAILSRAYPFRTDVTEVPAKYEGLQLEIAAYLIDKRGAEGEVTHTENGVTRQYENGDIPPTLLRRIIPEAGVLV